MSMDFYVLADQAKELFALGGGPWGGFKDRGGNPALDYHEIPLDLVKFKDDEEGFAKHFLECWESGCIEGRGDTESRAFMRHIGRKLWQWCWDRAWFVSLVTDHDGNSDEWSEYPETGSRYEEDK